MNKRSPGCKCGGIIDYSLFCAVCSMPAATLYSDNEFIISGGATSAALTYRSGTCTIKHNGATITTLSPWWHSVDNPGVQPPLLILGCDPSGAVRAFEELNLTVAGWTLAPPNATANITGAVTGHFEATFDVTNVYNSCVPLQFLFVSTFVVGAQFHVAAAAF